MIQYNSMLYVTRARHFFRIPLFGIARKCKPRRTNELHNYYYYYYHYYYYYYCYYYYYYATSSSGSPFSESLATSSLSVSTRQATLLCAFWRQLMILVVIVVLVVLVVIVVILVIM